MSCSPTYSFRPTFVPSAQKCIVASYVEHRARTGLVRDPTPPSGSSGSGGGTTTIEGLFFRSRGLGYENNDITIQMTSSQFFVRFQGIIVETYNLTRIADLRVALNNASSIVEIMALDVDIYEPRERDRESTKFFGFGPVRLQGGSGGPTTDTALESIRTGPERSLIIITTTEDFNGNDITPPISRRVKQWNGFRWVMYSNSIPGACPFEGIA